MGRPCCIASPPSTIHLRQSRMQWPSVRCARPSWSSRDLSEGEFMTGYAVSQHSPVRVKSSHLPYIAGLHASSEHYHVLGQHSKCCAPCLPSPTPQLRLLSTQTFRWCVFWRVLKQDTDKGIYHLWQDHFKIRLRIIITSSDLYSYLTVTPPSACPVR